MLSNIGQAYQNLVQKKQTNSIFANLFFWRPASLFIDILSSGAGYTIHSNMRARPAILVDAFPISDSRLWTKLAGENSFCVLFLKFTETGLAWDGTVWFWVRYILGEYKSRRKKPLPQLSLLTFSFSWEKIYFGAFIEYYIGVQWNYVTFFIEMIPKFLCLTRGPTWSLWLKSVTLWRGAPTVLLDV